MEPEAAHVDEATGQPSPSRSNRTVNSGRKRRRKDISNHDTSNSVPESEIALETPAKKVAHLYLHMYN